jgi:hypothetical protein
MTTIFGLRGTDKQQIDAAGSTSGKRFFMKTVELGIEPSSSELRAFVMRPMSFLRHRPHRRKSPRWRAWHGRAISAAG